GILTLSLSSVGPSKVLPTQLSGRSLGSTFRTLVVGFQPASSSPSISHGLPGSGVVSQRSSGSSPPSFESPLVSLPDSSSSAESAPVSASASDPEALDPSAALVASAESAPPDPPAASVSA